MSIENYYTAFQTEFEQVGDRENVKVGEALHDLLDEIVSTDKPSDEDLQLAANALQRVLGVASVRFLAPSELGVIKNGGILKIGDKPEEAIHFTRDHDHDGLIHMAYPIPALQEGTRGPMYHVNFCEVFGLDPKDATADVLLGVIKEEVDG